MKCWAWHSLCSLIDSVQKANSLTFLNVIICRLSKHAQLYRQISGHLRSSVLSWECKATRTRATTITSRWVNRKKFQFVKESNNCRTKLEFFTNNKEYVIWTVSGAKSTSSRYSSVKSAPKRASMSLTHETPSNLSTGWLICTAWQKLKRWGS